MRPSCHKMVAQSLGWQQCLTELLKLLTPIENRCVGAVPLDAFDGVRLDLVSVPPTPGDHPYTGSRRIPVTRGTQY